MAIYATLGITQALMTLVLGLAMAFFNFYASRNLHKNAVHRVFFAPSSFFDTVPLGRIMGVFGKDFDTVDNILPESLRNVVRPIPFSASVPSSFVAIFFPFIDSTLLNPATTSFQQVMTVSNVVGSIILITIFEYYCESRLSLFDASMDPASDSFSLRFSIITVIVAAVVVICGYVYFQRYYQKTGRELKRIDSMLRSLLYSVSRSSLFLP